MPYVVTTKRPTPIVAGGHGWDSDEYGLVDNENPIVSRHAVATLEEARDKGWAEARRHLHVDQGASEWVRWGDAFRDLPESGGTVGPLPDGTVIKVEPTSKQALFDALPVDDQRSLPTWPLPTLAMVIAAFNAREVAA
jgi:hypothetical protein